MGIEERMDDLKKALQVCLNEILTKILEKQYPLLYQQIEKIVSDGDEVLRTESDIAPDYEPPFYQHGLA